MKGSLSCKETSAKLYDIIWLDNVNNYDLLQLTGLRIWAFGRDHPIDYWRSCLLAQLHQVQSRWSEDEIDAYLCGPKWFMTNRSLLFCKKCKQDPRTKSTKAKKDHTATKKDKKKFCHQYQLSARRWTKSTLTPRQAVASFLLFRISLAGDIIVVVRSHLTSVMAL